MLEACRRHFPAEVIEFIKVIADKGTKRGIRQGSPASPLLTNIFYDNCLDRPWHPSRPELPLFRYAADMLLVCQTIEDATDAYSWFAQ
jgi:hypothetical protein